jgi:hypothetical protein
VTETPGEYLDHEPPPAREPMGYRDTGSDMPSAVSTDRPAGVAGADSDAGVQPEAAPSPDAPDLRSGAGSC